MSRLVVTTGTGATSCLSVRLHDAVNFRRQHGVYPDEIDSSQQFGLYRTFYNQNVSDIILGSYVPDNSLPVVDFDHGWQFAWYDEIQLDKLSPLASMICPVSSKVGDQSYNYGKTIGDRTGVVYRGNDKELEIQSTPYEAMVSMARDTGSEKFVVQTDEQEFLDCFKQAFPDTIYFDDIPRAFRKNSKWNRSAAASLDKVPPSKRVDHVVKFIAALRSIAKCEKLILNTGNIGLWTMLFRGHTQNVWQFHGQHQTYRKLS